MEEETTVETPIVVVKPYRVHVNRKDLFDTLHVKKHHIVFAGDSISQRNEWNEILNDPNAINRGIDSDNAGELLSRIDQILKGEPQKLFIKIGINDLYYNKDPKIVLDTHREIIRLTKEFSPDTKLYIQSLLPVNNTKYAHPMNNQKIKDFNGQLKTLVEENEVEFIDMYEDFLTPDLGEMDPRYTFDGAHLSGEGYLKWKEMLIKHEVIEDKPLGMLLETTVDEFDSAPHYKNRTSLFKELPLNEESIVFLGDSMSQRNEWREQFSLDQIANRGIDSDTTAGVYARLGQILPYNVKKIFLMIGVNDISNGVNHTDILENYEKIIAKINEASPDTELFVQSILPVNNSFYNHHMDNQDVIDVNKNIEKLCSKYNCTYINLYDDLKASFTNELDMNYTGDGVHLCGAGYKAWVEKIKPYVIS